MLCCICIACEQPVVESGIEHPVETKNTIEARTVDLLVSSYRKHRGTFELRDKHITPLVINRFLVRIGETPIDDFATEPTEVMLLGKKRCTKPKNGRRFCIQRKGFLHWKFGWE